MEFKELIIGSFTPDSQNLSRHILDFGRKFCEMQRRIDYQEICSIFLSDKETLKKINETKMFMHIKSKGGLKIEEFLKEYFDKIEMGTISQIDGRIYSINEETGIVEFNPNEFLIKFLSCKDGEGYEEKKIEVLFLIDLYQKRGMELFCKLLNDSDLEIAFLANNEFQKKNSIYKKEGFNLLYNFLNACCSPDEAHVFFKFLREDPNIFKRLYVDRPVGLRILLDALNDRESHINTVARNSLDKLLDSPHFVEAIGEYINIYARPRDIGAIYQMYIKDETKLDVITPETYSGLKIFLTAMLDSREEVKEKAESRLEDYFIGRKNRKTAIEYLFSDYASKDDVYVLLDLFSRNKFQFDKPTIFRIKELVFKFPNLNFVLTAFTELAYNGR